MLNVAIRADATSQIGTGHFMRCLTLADALRKRGAQICFISRSLPVHLSGMLSERHFEYVPLKSDIAEESSNELAHSKWLGVSQKQDARDTEKALNNRTWDLLIVDHYALDIRWERALRGSVRRIMVIDDIADRAHDCDLLLDQNYFADMQTRYEGKVSKNCRLLLGPRYALLREEFRELRELVKLRTAEVKRILVFFGGVDEDNYTGLAVEALAGSAIEDIAVDVVIGSQHPRRSDIERVCKTLGYVCHVQISRMAELMANADLAIGAGGSASWERCCLGLPALLIALADNQIDIVKALNSVGACIYLGTKETVEVFAIRRSINLVLSSSSQIELISQHAYSLVDGMGAARVCEELGY